MSDEPAPTVRDRLTAAGISAEAIDRHHVDRAIWLNGETVEDLDTPAAKPARVVIGPS